MSSLERAQAIIESLPTGSETHLADVVTQRRMTALEEIRDALAEDARLRQEVVFYKTARDIILRERDEARAEIARRDAVARSESGGL